MNDLLPNCVVPTNFAIAGVEDFDSDGDGDIMWRHDTGTVVWWQIETFALVANRTIGVVSTTWQIKGAGEFDLL